MPDSLGGRALHSRTSRGRRRGLGWVMALLIPALPLAAWAQAPGNDAWAAAAPLSGISVSAVGTNGNATREPGEPDHAGNRGGRSVWWRWIAPAEGWVQVSLEGSTFDTLLGVYQGDALATLDLVATNDDARPVNTSALRFPARAGVTYHLAVDGFNPGNQASTGMIELALHLAPGPVAHPENDDWAAARPLGEGSARVEADTLNASREPREPWHAGRPGQASLWYQWTSPAGGPLAVTAHTDGSDFDTLLAVYTGTTLGTLAEVAANDDDPSGDGITTSRLDYVALPGQRYWLAVDGYDGATGQVRLSWEYRVATELRLGLPVARDDGAVEIALSGTPGRVCTLEAASALGPWSTVTTLTNGTGRVVVSDPGAARQPLRLYRAWER